MTTTLSKDEINYLKNKFMGEKKWYVVDDVRNKSCNCGICNIKIGRGGYYQDNFFITQEIKDDSLIFGTLNVKYDKVENGLCVCLECFGKMENKMDNVRLQHTSVSIGGCVSFVKYLEKFELFKKCFGGVVALQLIDFEETRQKLICEYYKEPCEDNLFGYDF